MVIANTARIDLHHYRATTNLHNTLLAGWIYSFIQSLLYTNLTTCPNVLETKSNVNDLWPRWGAVTKVNMMFHFIGWLPSSYQLLVVPVMHNMWTPTVFTSHWYPSGIHIFLIYLCFCCPGKTKSICYIEDRICLLSGPNNYFTVSVKSCLHLMATTVSLTL